MMEQLDRLYQPREIRELTANCEAYAKRWIAQFDGSSLKKIMFLPAGRFSITVCLTFNVPLHSQGNLFSMQCYIPVLNGVKVLEMHLARTQAEYEKVAIHAGLKFTPMEANDARHEN